MNATPTLRNRLGWARNRRSIVGLPIWRLLSLYALLASACADEVRFDRTRALRANAVTTAHSDALDAVTDTTSPDTLGPDGSLLDTLDAIPDTTTDTIPDTTDTIPDTTTDTISDTTDAGPDTTTDTSST